MTELELNEILKCDENPPAEFNVNLVTAFSAIVRDEGKTYEESIKDVNLDIACTQLKPNLNQSDKLLLDSLLDEVLPIPEIKLKPLLKPLFGDKSNTLIKDISLWTTSSI